MTKTNAIKIHSCPTCKGSGKIIEGVCPSCMGSGELSDPYRDNLD